MTKSRTRSKSDHRTAVLYLKGVWSGGFTNQRQSYDLMSMSKNIYARKTYIIKTKITAIPHSQGLFLSSVCLRFVRILVTSVCVAVRKFSVFFVRCEFRWPFRKRYGRILQILLDFCIVNHLCCRVLQHCFAAVFIFLRLHCNIRYSNGFEVFFNGVFYTRFPVF